MSDVPTAEPLRVALVGLRASGKSTLGPVLARRLGASFVDLDRETARIARARGVGAAGGRSPRAGDVLRNLGEAAFRDLEEDALAAALALGVACVLATGGGVVERAGARAALRAHWRTVWLDAPLERLRARLAASTEDRPALLGGSDAAAEVGAVAERRRPLYASLGALRIEPGAHEAPVALAERVARELGLAHVSPPRGARLAARRTRRYPRGGAHGNDAKG